MNSVKRIFAFCFILLISASLYPAQRIYINQDSYSKHTDTPQYLFDEFYENNALIDMTLEQWFDGPHAMGNWYGARTLLAKNGIVPLFTYLGNFAANPSGGDKHGATNTSCVHLGVGIDLSKLSGLKSLDGWSIGNAWVWRFGQSLTKDYIHNTFNVQQNYGSQNIRLQSLFAIYNKNLSCGETNFTFKFGRFAAGDNFMCKPIYWLYQNNAFDGNPVGVFNQTKWSAYPGGTWAVYSQLKDGDGRYVKAGVYQINSDKQDSMNMHGLDWSFTNAAGVNANFEFGWDINHDNSGKSPGNISAGLVADWYSAEHLDNSSVTSPFNCTIYLQADYMIWNMGKVKGNEPSYIRRTEDEYRDLRGLVLWGVLQYDPYEYLAKMPWFLSGRLLFNAPFESRADDVVCFGIAYGKFSNKLDDYKQGGYEIALELNYKLQINRFSFVQPNIQYIVNTDAGRYPNALVLGIQYGLSL